MHIACMDENIFSNDLIGEGTFTVGELCNNGSTKFYTNSLDLMFKGASAGKLIFEVWNIEYYCPRTNMLLEALFKTQKELVTQNLGPVEVQVANEEIRR